MPSRRVFVRFWWLVAIAVAPTGCQDPAVGTIKAKRPSTDRPENAPQARPNTNSRSKSKPSRKGADFNDLSPKTRGKESKP